MTDQPDYPTVPGSLIRATACDAMDTHPAPVLALGYPDGEPTWEARDIPEGFTYADEPAVPVPAGWHVVGISNGDVVVDVVVDSAVTSDGGDASEMVARALADHLNGDAS